MPSLKKSSAPAIFHYEFPYVKFHGRSYPLIPVTLKRKTYTVSTFALLDSGASLSVFRPEIARALHLTRKNGEEARMGTATGGVDINIHRVRVSVKKTSFNAGIGFSKQAAASFNIVGREGFFNHFSVCFNEIMKTVIMVPLRKMHS